MSLLNLAASPANDNQFRGCLYFMFSDQCMKIGVAINPEDRRRTFQTGCPHPIQLGAVIDTVREVGLDPYEVERTYHQFLAPFKTQGEWFEIPERGTQAAKDFTFQEKLAYAYWKYPYLYDAWYRRTEKLAAKIS